MAKVDVITSKTKKGTTIQVAVIPQELAPGLENHFAASDIAKAHGCTHYRVVSAAGQIVGSGKAGAVLQGSYAPDDRRF